MTPLAIPANGLADENIDSGGSGFFQQPFAQNVLPFITSLSVHAGILIFGLLVFGAVKMVKTQPMQVEIIIPETEFYDYTPAGGIPTVGLKDTLFRPSAQDTGLTTVSGGWSPTNEPSADLAPAGLGQSEASILDCASVMIGGANGDRSNGPGNGLGAIKMFGAPGDGGNGLTGYFCGVPSGNVRRIVYLCDATGSMINKIATLKDELNKSVVSLKPIQSFDVIFYQDINVEPMSPGLIPATPANKRKAGTYMEGVTSTGPTDPIPAMAYALKLKPQLIYFLTDAADFPDPDALVDTIKKCNPNNQTKISTILFVENRAEHEKNSDSENFMKKIASDTGGHFRWVEMDTLP